VSPISNLSVVDIQNQHVTLKGTQWDIYVRSILGQRVHWQGVINGLHNDRSVNVEVPGEASWVVVTLDNIPDGIFVNLRKGQRVEFEARVYTIYKFMWLYINLDQVAFLN
jgi:hypothetical protein